MGRIVISENMSLDGVVQDPTGEEGSRPGGWFGRTTDEDRAAWAQVELEEALNAEALLFGRRSYEWFAARWPTRTGEWADRLNTLPKYVVSSTLDDADWTNTALLKGEAVGEVTRLKQHLAGDILVYASFQLLPTLLEHNLVDELRLMIYPVLLGVGKRLFDQPIESKPLRLNTMRSVGDSLALLTYEPVHRA